MFRKFSHWFDISPSNQNYHTCYFQGCQEPGKYRAPKSRYNLDHGINDWNWFCLTHIREYNSKWDYYKGMNEEEITKERVSDITWDRPTWPLGHNTSFKEKSLLTGEEWYDPFHFFPSTASASPPTKPSLSKQEIEALAILGLTWPFTCEDLRKSYYTLAKRYHPDCNKNNPSAEDKIRALNEAYHFLKEKYF